MNGKLYIVATPIGNLGDMPPRAVEALRGADIIAAEDTQNSMTLLCKFDIKTKLVSNHKFNEAGSAAYFIKELQSGKNIALISDAGTPCVSDPGSVLVRRAIENGVEVVGVPGACAAVLALSVSGFDARTFVFLGFFPRENAAAGKLAEKMETEAGVYIFYESPKRIIKTFEYMENNLPECEICLCNDLTKKFEMIYRGSPAQILEQLRNNPNAEKGEYTAAANVPPKRNGPAPPFDMPAEALIVEVMVKQNCGAKDAVKYLASQNAHNFKKNDLYAASLNLKKMFGDEN